jgi:hypothetical protein
MKKLLKYMSFLALVVFCLSLATGAMAEITKTPSGQVNPQAVIPNPGGHPGYFIPCQQPPAFCVKWNPPRLDPVQVWRQRCVPTWYPVTYYRYVQGQWQFTDPQTGQPLQGQPQQNHGGYFDHLGMWHPYPTQGMWPQYQMVPPQQ